jgi:phospholipid/cholesterol/gamma-HCH transport system ATP-binding protein
MAAPQEPILEFQDVSLKFGDTWALRKVSLGLSPGETRIVFGAAGSGKTTLLKAVIGLVQVNTGGIKLFGREITSSQEAELFPLRARAGVLFQEGGLFDSLTVGENVEYPLLNQKTNQKTNLITADVESRVREALRFVELEHTFDRFPSELSGGMRRRVGIARAIVTEPPLVLYDSPTAGLDPITANTIMALVAKERDVRNSASIIVTYRYQDGEIMSDFRYDQQHEDLVALTDDNDAARNRTKFIVMKEGEVVFFGSKQEMEASRDQYVQRFVRHGDEGHDSRKRKD